MLFISDMWVLVGLWGRLVYLGTIGIHVIEPLEVMRSEAVIYKTKGKTIDRDIVKVIYDAGRITLSKITDYKHMI